MVRKDQEKWDKFVESAFAAANLPEVPEDQLEVGTYTNRQIAERFRDNPMGLLALLMQLPKGGGAASRRSILSFAVDMRDSEE